MTRRGAVVALVLILTGCSAREHATTTASPTSTTSTTSTTAVSPPTTTTTTPTSTTTRQPTTSAPAPAPAQPPQLRGVTGGQAIVVTAAGYGQTTAKVTAFERAGNGWRAVAGPWTARVGSAGLAPPGTKREGDRRTPSGTYGFDFMFGVKEDPGVQFPFRRVTGPNIVWDDDPASAHYNEWVDTNTQDAGATPEPMYVQPAYDLGAVIAYNAARTPGLGSAIFLHVSAGRSTAGCVALPADQLRSVLTWLDPRRSPVMVIGTS